jgi:hypothetical protein
MSSSDVGTKVPFGRTRCRASISLGDSPKMSCRPKASATTSTCSAFDVIGVTHESLFHDPAR